VLNLNESIASYMNWPLDDDLISAIECACITTQEWLDNPNECVQRVRGALEEQW